MKLIATLLVFSLLLSACGQGPIGPKGDPGTAGSPGQAGAPGLAGRNGTSCSTTILDPGVQAPNGGALIACTDGSYSVVLNGSNGSDGKDASPATVVTPIQFCPGIPSYPSAFPEVGFSIGGKIYAVYSANDGFLAYMPPGQYQSNAVGSSCTFTINADGTISN